MASRPFNGPGCTCEGCGKDRDRTRRGDQRDSRRAGAAGTPQRLPQKQLPHTRSRIRKWRKAMRGFDLYDATTVNQAVDLLRQHSGKTVKVLGGGSDLVGGVMKDWVYGKGMPL